MIISIKVMKLSNVDIFVDKRGNAALLRLKAESHSKVEKIII